MKKLGILAIILTTSLLVGCTSHTDNMSHDASQSHQDSVTTDNHEMNIDHSSMGHNMQHATITSEEQFIAEMIPHHQEAVDTAKIIVEKTQNPALKSIAQAIIDDQSHEINTLHGWLQTRFPNSTYKATYQNMMRPLENLSGVELDTTFMEDMIKHHAGAIQMAEQLLALSPREELKIFANNVISAQSQEIKEFDTLLQK